MNLAISVDQKQLMNVLLNVGTVRPVFIWGAPGIGKSAIVEQFASDVGLECVSLLGSQLAPEDIIGVPQIVDGRSVAKPVPALTEYIVQVILDFSFTLLLFLRGEHWHKAFQHNELS